MKTRTTARAADAKKAYASQKKAPNQKAIMSVVMNTHDENSVATESLPRVEEIASRAYKIWQEQGCPEGCDEMNWQLAEKELLSAAPGGSRAW
ncbi:DUF2934 domain-containing protein [Prosthecobacter sp.]|uniref:DUF2934 domain-containing protein n=1 Tax=Prosthecobacter sp. TaxID=1965333 RepID=UPI002ABA6E3E|nr:DUF2934 domain-containing protein [Prosthecobacter sp.]MDZ4403979.1 DUF2934 domain-containing protein [Prosthecobacter sp.]